MYRDSALAQALIRDHVAELRRSSQTRTRKRHEQRPRQALAVARREVGWVLVETGLRLALSRSPMSPGASQRTAIGGKRTTLMLGDRISLR